MKEKRKVLIIVELILFVICGLIMYEIQLHLFFRNADREIDLTLQDVDRIVERIQEETSDNFDSYEMILKAKAKMAKYYISNDENTRYSKVSMVKLKELLDVSNVFITDKDGEIIYYADESSIKSFSDEDINYFGMMEPDSEINDVFDVAYSQIENESEKDESVFVSTAICAARMNSIYYVVITDDVEALFERQGESASWDALLPHVTLGKNGFVFAIEDDGWVSAFSDPDEEQVINVSELGISMSDVRNGFRGTMKLQGDLYYCGIKHYDIGINMICAIPLNEITSNGLTVTAVPLFVVFVFLTIQLLYSLMLMDEWEADERNADTMSIRRFLFKKMSFLLVLSILFTVGFSLYTQVLYAMYLQAESNSFEADALCESLQRNEENQKRISEEYYRHLETLTTLAAKFISNNPERTSRKELAEMASNLGAEHILLYDKDGKVILSDAYYRGIRLSTDPNELSYEFRRVLTGTPVLAQKEVDKNYLDSAYRYVGAIITDENDQLNGFVQLAFSPYYLGRSLSATTVGTIPSTFSGRNNAYAFIVDENKKTFLYYPEEDMIDEPVEDYGLTDEILQDEYVSRILFDGQERLLYCKSWEDYLIFTVASVSMITMGSVNRSIYISIAGILIQFIFFAVIVFMAEKKGSYAESDTGRVTDDDSKIKLIEKQAAERIMNMVTFSLFVFSGSICLIMLLRDSLFKNHTVLLNLLNGQWNDGIHIFSVTACWVHVCMIYFTTAVLLIVLELMGKLMSSRGETVVRMLISFIRYIAVIGAAFQCAKSLGVHTDTLLASAGILTIVVGLGAQSLVTDVLAGLFIIFEKSFKVGDIIKLDNWRGRVLEIGIRNTRVHDIDENSIKVLHNSSLNQIVNLSDLPTCIYTLVGTEYSEQLERIEGVIERELPEIQKRIPMAIEGPTYRGVSELGNSAVILKFMTKCRNEDFYPVKHAVNRELKLMFDRNSINIPFDQIVISQREDGTSKTGNTRFSELWKDSNEN